MAPEGLPIDLLFMDCDGIIFDSNNLKSGLAMLYLQSHRSRTHLWVCSAYQTIMCEDAYRRALAKMDVPAEEIQKYIAWVNDDSLLLAAEVCFVALSCSIESSTCETLIDTLEA